jgi:hypothetical protein
VVPPHGKLTDTCSLSEMFTAVKRSFVTKVVVNDTKLLLIRIAVPPKGLSISGPEQTVAFIADEPNTK